MTNLENLSIEEISEHTGVDLAKHYASKEFPSEPLPDGRELLTRTITKVKPDWTEVLGHASERSESVEMLKVTSAWFSWTRGIWTFRTATVIEWWRGGRSGGEGWVERERHFFPCNLTEQDARNYAELYERIGRASKITVKEF